MGNWVFKNPTHLLLTQTHPFDIPFLTSSNCGAGVNGAITTLDLGPRSSQHYFSILFSFSSIRLSSYSVLLEYKPNGF
jgi:hypothetical protein